MIYRDISNHQLLQSCGIFETPHVKPEVLSAKKDWISQSETNSLIRRFVDPGIFCMFNGHLSKTACTAQNVGNCNSGQAQAAMKTIRKKMSEKLMIMALRNSPLSSI